MRSLRFGSVLLALTLVAVASSAQEAKPKARGGVRAWHDREVASHLRALERGDWSLNLGVIWTPQKAPRYELVPDTAGQSMIARTKDETRSGQPVLMLSFRPQPESYPRHIASPARPYLQFGTGLQFSKPSFYVGAAIDLGPYAQVGGGWSAQQIEKLKGGLEEGDVVSQGTTLRTRDHFAGSTYVAFTLKLEALARLFRSGESAN